MMTDRFSGTIHKIVPLKKFAWELQELKRLESRIFDETQEHDNHGSAAEMTEIATTSLTHSSDLDDPASLFGIPSERVQPIEGSCSQTMSNFLPLEKFYYKMGKSLPINSEDIVIQFSIRYPHSVRNRLKMCEVELLASQPLTALRDAFFCPCDHTEIGDEVITNNTLECKKSSSVIVIENMIFVDTRDANSSDYSEEILDWYRKSCPDSHKDAFIRKRMDVFRIGELTLRLNYPYLLVHQGRCSHIIYVKGIRRVVKAELSKGFPNYLYISKVFRPKCFLCDAFVPKWVTVNDEYAAENPCLWCDSCFNLFHYKEDGSLLYGEFERYRYNLLY